MCVCARARARTLTQVETVYQSRQYHDPQHHNRRHHFSPSLKFYSWLSCLLEHSVCVLRVLGQLNPMLICLSYFFSIGVSSNHAASSVDITASLPVFTSRLFKDTDSTAGHRETNMVSKITTNLARLTDALTGIEKLASPKFLTLNC